MGFELTVTAQCESSSQRMETQKEHLSDCWRVKEPLSLRSVAIKMLLFLKWHQWKSNKGICCISDEFWSVWELFARTNIKDLRSVNIFSVMYTGFGGWE